MATEHILALLLAERDKLSAAIEALQSGRTVEKTETPAVPQKRRAKRRLSAAGKRAIIAGTKKRWAAVKSAKAAAAAPAAKPAKPAAPPVKKPGTTDEGTKAPSSAMKTRSVAKKKAAAKKGA